MDSSNYESYLQTLIYEDEEDPLADYRQNIWDWCDEYMGQPEYAKYCEAWK